MHKLAFAALIGASALAISVTAASARIVCNADGDCWHVQTEYPYPPALALTIHPDDWKWKDTEHFKWREHVGHGYWKGNDWTEF